MGLCRGWLCVGMGAQTWRGTHILQPMSSRFYNVCTLLGWPCRCRIVSTNRARSSRPYLVVAYIEGRTEFAPAHLPTFLTQCAAQLAQIHRVDGATLEVDFLPQRVQTCAELLQACPAVVDDSLSEGAIREALEAVWPLVQRNPVVVLHGDFWPGNLLWRDERIVAVIDWEDAAQGDPLADVANSRLEFLWSFGAEAMQLFTQSYQASAGIDLSELASWDLYAALRPIARLAQWGLEASVERTMRARHAWFVAQALSRL